MQDRGLILFSVMIFLIQEHLFYNSFVSWYVSETTKDINVFIYYSICNVSKNIKNSYFVCELTSNIYKYIHKVYIIHRFSNKYRKSALKLNYLSVCPSKNVLFPIIFFSDLMQFLVKSKILLGFVNSNILPEITPDSIFLITSNSFASYDCCHLCLPNLLKNTNTYFNILI